MLTDKPEIILKNIFSFLKSKVLTTDYVKVVAMATKSVTYVRI